MSRHTTNIIGATVKIIYICNGECLRKGRNKHTGKVSDTKYRMSTKQIPVPLSTYVINLFMNQTQDFSQSYIIYTIQLGVQNGKFVLWNHTILAHTFGTATELEALNVSVQQNKNMFYHFKTPPKKKKEYATQFSHPVEVGRLLPWNAGIHLHEYIVSESRNTQFDQMHDLINHHCKQLKNYTESKYSKYYKHTAICILKQWNVTLI